jgi:hypothetical protein
VPGDDAVDGSGRLAAVANGLHDRGAAIDAVAAREDARHGWCACPDRSERRCLSSRAQGGEQVGGGFWPMALMTVSASTTNSEPGIGSGRASGRVGRTQPHADALDARDAVGADELDRRHLGDELTPSRLAAAISWAKAGMSASPRR